MARYVSFLNDDDHLSCPCEAPALEGRIVYLMHRSNLLNVFVYVAPLTFRKGYGRHLSLHLDTRDYLLT